MRHEETAQITRIETTYLMTLHAPIASPPRPVDSVLTIFRAGDHGWAKGPRISGTIIQPTADWLRAMPSGCLRVDARMTIQTDDGALIYVAYNGVISVPGEDFERMSRGETLTSDDVYFIIAPTFETAHEGYAWLNPVQAVGKVVAVRGGDEGFVRYDVFAIS